MANWAEVEYVATGLKEYCEKLYNFLSNLLTNSENKEAWFQDILKKLGKPEDEFSEALMKGYITSVGLDKINHRVHINSEQAYGEHDEIREFLEKEFHVNILYRETMWDLEVYHTNDTDHIIFPKYVFQYFLKNNDVKVESFLTKSYSSLDEIEREVAKSTKDTVKFTSVKDVNKYIQKFENEDIYQLTLVEYL